MADEPTSVPVPSNLRPDKWHPKGVRPGTIIDGKPRCGAYSRNSDKPCMKKAGWGTHHPGNGRCKFHGGLTPSGTARYASVVTGKLAEDLQAMEADPHALSPMSELALLRTFLRRFLESHGMDLERMRVAGEGTEGNIVPEIGSEVLTNALKLIDTIGKTIGRIERTRALSALSMNEVRELVRKLAGAVERVVQDPKTLDRVVGEWKVILAEISGAGGAQARANWSTGEED